MGGIKTAANPARQGSENPPNRGHGRCALFPKNPAKERDEGKGGVGPERRAYLFQVGGHVGLDLRLKVKRQERNQDDTGEGLDDTAPSP